VVPRSLRSPGNLLGLFFCLVSTFSGMALRDIWLIQL
jgi:hypothetical protein